MAILWSIVLNIVMQGKRDEDQVAHTEALVNSCRQSLDVAQVEFDNFLTEARVK